MEPNKAGVRLTLEDGTDLADKIDPRFIELSLSEKRGGEADELSLTLQNVDGKLASPRRGVYINLELGWISGQDRTLGLVNKGRFRVDEVGRRGPPDSITIRARSADLTGAYPKRRTRTWSDTTVGTVLSEIATRNGATASVHPDLADEAIDVLEQQNKSDMAFVQDLGRHFDALATWKDKRLVFLPVGSTTNASGQTLATRTITRQDGWTWEFTEADRDGQDGTEAQYHDGSKGERKTVSTGGNNRHRLKHIYASKSSATRAAKSDAARRARAKSTFTYDLAVADPRLLPNMGITLSGWDNDITGLKWLVESLDTALGPGGIIQKLKLEGV